MEYSYSNHSNTNKNNNCSQLSNKSYPSRTIVHAKLEMTEPGDQDEQEADAIANTIAAGGKISRKISGGSGSSGITVSNQMESQLNHLQGGGQAMPTGLRSMMESGFGQDFSHVRLHTDSEAASLSSSIHAKAFTHGSDIYFNQGQFSPNTSEGQKLMAHELTHVVQGGGKVGKKPKESFSIEEFPIEFIKIRHLKDVNEDIKNLGIFLGQIKKKKADNDRIYRKNKETINRVIEKIIPLQHKTQINSIETIKNTGVAGEGAIGICAGALTGGSALIVAAAAFIAALIIEKVGDDAKNSLANDSEKNRREIYNKATDEFINKVMNEDILQYGILEDKISQLKDKAECERNGKFLDSSDNEYYTIAEDDNCPKYPEIESYRLNAEDYNDRFYYKKIEKEVNDYKNKVIEEYDENELFHKAAFLIFEDQLKEISYNETDGFECSAFFDPLAFWNKSCAITDELNETRGEKTKEIDQTFKSQHKLKDNL